MHFEPTLPDNYPTIKACSAPKFLNCSKYYLIIARSIFIWILYHFHMDSVSTVGVLSEYGRSSPGVETQ